MPVVADMESRKFRYDYPVRKGQNRGNVHNKLHVGYAPCGDCRTMVYCAKDGKTDDMQADVMRRLGKSYDIPSSVGMARTYKAKYVTPPQRRTSTRVRKTVKR